MLRRILLSRFVLVPGAIVAAALAWSLYAAQHANGLVTGTVVGPDGAPVAGATVMLIELNFTTNTERARTTTGADGRFRFDNNRSHFIQLRAEKAGVGRSPQREVRLYFAAQDVEVREPLRLAAAGKG
jgi:protocatechuate 3,4-dioxygenase beta subunit